MAIVQNADELRVMANSVGVADERSDDIYLVAANTTVNDTDDLATVVNVVGFYDEKADHLVEAGVTFA